MCRGRKLSDNNTGFSRGGDDFTNCGPLPCYLGEKGPGRVVVVSLLYLLGISLQRYLLLILIQISCWKIIIISFFSYPEYLGGFRLTTIQTLSGGRVEGCNCWACPRRQMDLDSFLNNLGDFSEQHGW